MCMQYPKKKLRCRKANQDCELTCPDLNTALDLIKTLNSRLHQDTVVKVFQFAGISPGTASVYITLLGLSTCVGLCMVKVVEHPATKSIYHCYNWVCLITLLYRLTCNFSICRATVLLLRS